MNAMTERMEFLHYRVKFIDRFVKSWEQTMSWIKRGEGDEDKDIRSIKVIHR